MVLVKLRLPTGELKLVNTLSRFLDSEKSGALIIAVSTLLIASRVDIASGMSRFRLVLDDKENPLLPLSFDFTQTVAKLCGYDIGRLTKTGLMRSERSGKSKVYIPTLYEALSPLHAKVPETTLLKTIPGKAIYTAYLTLREPGTPEAKARAIKEAFQKKLGYEAPTKEELSEIASQALILLTVTGKNEIRATSGIAEMPYMIRKIASETLKRIATMQ